MIFLVVKIRCGGEGILVLFGFDIFREHDLKKKVHMHIHFLIRVQIIDGTADPQHLAVDWISQSVYWTDATTRSIDMTDYHGEKRITVISGSLDQPFTIGVDPEVG